MAARSASRPRLHRDRSLMVRMVLVTVVTPLIALGATVALWIVAPHALRPGIVIALAIGLFMTLQGLQRQSQRSVGRELSEAEDPQLFAIVDRLCALADIGRPRLLLVDERQPNSWVVEFPRGAARLYITTALRDLLTVDELTAVIGHELAHIANRDALVMTVVGTPTMVMLRSNGGGFGGLFVVLIGVITQVGTTMLSRYRELAADAGSAAITGRPSALASALMKVSDGIAQIPSKDLRAAAALNAFNLVAVPASGRRRRGLGRFVDVPRSRMPARVFASHPPLQSRLDALHALERAQQRR
jgi:heat shock protein HtpX